MPMETYSCQTLLIGVDDLDITMDGKLLESMATVLRAELPERHVLDGQYTALNPTARKALELDEDSVEVRDDGVSLYAESAEFFMPTRCSLSSLAKQRQLWCFPRRSQLGFKMPRTRSALGSTRSKSLWTTM